MKLKRDPKVKNVFNSYPRSVKSKLLHLRELFLNTASEIEGLVELEETLKWGEPGYLTKHGSTIRIDWKKKKPEQFAMYFKCTLNVLPG